MKRNLICLAFLFATLLAAFPVSTVNAARGVPGNPEFGYGVALNTTPGTDVNISTVILQSFTQEVKPDWVSIDFNWADLQPDPNQPVDLSSIAPFIEYSSIHQYPILVKLCNAPAWAQTAFGPSAQFTIQLISELLTRYPKTIQAIEIFPAANTLEGWGALPDPLAYTELFRSIQLAVTEDMNSSTLLVAAGLLLNPPDAGHSMDMAALDYLKGLYQAGAKEIMPVISLQYGTITGEVLDSVQSGKYPLRYYEEIRRTMLENDHAVGLIWITRLPVSSTTTSRMEWLESACNLLRAQLFIGTVFIDMPTSQAEPGNSNGALVFNLDQVEQVLKILKKLMFQNAPEEWLSKSKTFYLSLG